MPGSSPDRQLLIERRLRPRNQKYRERYSIGGGAHPNAQVIRKYAPPDCERIIEIWFAATVIATQFLSDDFLAQESESIRSTWLPKAETWVFEHDGNVVGFVSLIGDEVGAIFVHPDSQGSGIGRELMDHAANLRGQLFLDVFEDNAVGRRFYDRYGFKFEHKHLHEPSGHMQHRLSYKPS